MNRRSKISSLFAAFVLATGAAQATTLVRMSLDQLTATATIVARVRCLGNESRWEAGEIWTLTSFEVLETLKGAAPRQITVRLIGGRVGHLLSTVDGVPRFRSGEEAVLFLEPAQRGELSVTGWVQGTFRIRRDPPTGAASVTQDSAGFPAFDPATRQFRSEGIQRMPLALFRQRVIAAVRRQESTKQP